MSVVRDPDLSCSNNVSVRYQDKSSSSNAYSQRSRLHLLQQCLRYPDKVLEMSTVRDPDCVCYSNVSDIQARFQKCLQSEIQTVFALAMSPISRQDSRNIYSQRSRLYLLQQGLRYQNKILEISTVRDPDCICSSNVSDIQTRFQKCLQLEIQTVFALAMSPISRQDSRNVCSQRSRLCFYSSKVSDIQTRFQKCLQLEVQTRVPPGSVCRDHDYVALAMSHSDIQIMFFLVMSIVIIQARVPPAMPAVRDPDQDCSSNVSVSHPDEGYSSILWSEIQTRVPSAMSAVTYPD